MDKQYYDCADSVETRRVPARSAADAFAASWGMPPEQVECATDLDYEGPAAVASLDVDANWVDLTFEKTALTANPLVLEVRAVEEPH